MSMMFVPLPIGSTVRPSAGHSMGGYVVQKYLETHDATAGVLMASAPPQGAMGASLRIAAHDAPSPLGRPQDQHLW